MFELITPTPAQLKSVTPRTEMHGEEKVVALSLRLELTAPNTILDLLSTKLRHALYMQVEGQEQLPGVEPSTPLLRFDAFDHHAIKACFEGWTLFVDHGVDEDDPIALGGCKVDAFRLEALQGGTVKLAFRVGTNDISSEEIGVLCGKLGSEISITLRAPEKPVAAIDASSSATDLPPTAGDLFAKGHGPDDDEEGDADTGEGSDPDAGDGQAKGEDWPFPRPNAGATKEPEVVIETSRPGTRTARGREKTKAALAAGLAAAESGAA